MCGILSKLLAPFLKNMENSKLDLTICSVYHSSETMELLETNYDFTKKLNLGEKYKWIAADGSEPGEKNEIDGNKFTRVLGVNSAGIGDVLSDPVLKNYKHSFLHARSLNAALKHVNTRFVVFLDDDFFIVRQGWMKDVKDFMTSKNLAFFGTPFHPRFFKRYRYFPCAQCLVVDLQKIKKEDLDFSPRYENITPGLAARAKNKILKNIFGSERCQVGGSRDTCYGLYEKYGKERSMYDFAVPSYDPGKDFIGPERALSRSNLLLEKFLPENYCFLPKEADSYTAVSFFDQRKFYGDEEIMKKYNLEEYVWKNESFGFHLKGVSKRFRRGQLNADNLISALKNL